MKALKYLNKYFYQYKFYFIIGIVITVFSKILALAWPEIVGNSLDVVDDYRIHKTISLDTLKNELVINTLKIVGFAVLSGFFTFLMRQTIIVSSRKIEYDLKNEIYDQYQKEVGEYPEKIWVNKDDPHPNSKGHDIIYKSLINELNFTKGSNRP